MRFTREENAMTRKSNIAAAAIAGCIALAGANAANAADIAVSSNAPTTFVLSALIPMFETASGNKVTVTYEGVPAIAEKVTSGTVDLVINAPAVIDGLVKDGKIAGPRIDLFTSGVGLAVKAGAPKPDISSADALKKTLLAAKSVAHSQAQSGMYFLTVLDRLGIAEQMKPKLKVVATPVGAAAAKGDAEIAVQQLTELMPVPGAELVGPLPAELQTRIVYSAGVPASAKEPDAAKALLKFFGSPAAAAVIKARGLQPVLVD
jgi:molybdate transport system substrate-binding protein